jgi:hypothetical protein
VADRTIFQVDKTESEDKAVLWEHEECGDDADMDSVDSIPACLSARGKGKSDTVIIYQFCIGNKDDVISVKKFA